MSGMSGGSMLRTRRKDVNVKPNRKLDRKSSRGMLYENEELRLRTININAEVERGQSDIKKLKRENEQLKREISSLRYEYDKLDKLLRERVGNRSSEGSEDSESCCSDCEEKACKQNDVNAVHDENSCNSRAGGAAGSLHVAFNSLMVVPEEAVGSEDASRDANVDTEDLDENRDCDCEECRGEQIINSELSYPSTSKAISTQYCDTILPYESPTLSAPPAIFSTPTIPKRELDILINNNNIYTGDASLPGPPIGFVIPNQDQFNIFENMPHSQVISYNNPNTNKRFQTGGNVEDLLGDIQSSNSNNRNLVRDAIVMYNTRKVIQQQTITNSDLEVENKPEVNTIIRSDRNDGKTYYVTEKKLDLDYDYPKMTNIPESSSAWLEPRREPTNAENTVKQCKTTTTQTTLTTTEINSTVVMIDRKKLQPKNKMSFFSRSQSAPVEPIVEEPIYATVKKLPKKLRMVDVSNLEDEVSYNPEVLATEDVKSESIELSKDESASLSSSQHEVVPEPRKSSMKKKRFSIYFKRKSKMTDSKKKKPAEVVSSKRNQTNEGEKPSEEVVDNAASERLIAGASDSDTQIKGCQKHGKSKQVDSIPSNRSGGSGQGRNTPPNGNVGGEHRKTHKCSRRKKSIRSESGAKHKYSPMRNYFKQDSYQEMTTSHSERERTNSLSSSAASGFSVSTHKSRKISVSHPDGNIPWCGCWGNSCL